MEKVVLVLHLVIALAMVIVVLLQRSEGAGLVGPSGSSMMPVRGSGNILTRTTAILATLFFITSLTLAIMAGGHKRSASLADQISAQEQTQSVPVAPPTGAEAPVAPDAIMPQVPGLVITPPAGGAEPPLDPDAPAPQVPAPVKPKP